MADVIVATSHTRRRPLNEGGGVQGKRVYITNLAAKIEVKIDCAPPNFQQAELVSVLMQIVVRNMKTHIRNEGKSRGR